MSNGHNGDAPEYTFKKEKIHNRLDPDLQRIVLDRRSKRDIPFEMREVLEGGAEVVDVIAKLEDPNAPVEGLNIVGRVGRIVTGTVDADRIEEVRRHPNVLSLKGARKLRPSLFNSVPAIRASRHQLRAADFEFDGSGVIVGVIDHGCDISHPNFRKDDNGVPGGATRVLYLWDQRGGTNYDRPDGHGASPADYGYGREFNADAINDALVEAHEKGVRAHEILGYSLTKNNGVTHIIHGTAVTDVAAGGGRHGNAPGVAPGADIIFVDVSLDDNLTFDESVSNSRHLVEAVTYIFDKASELNRQAVINISQGYDAGPHDGSSPVEECLDQLLETPGRAIVMAAGNSHVRGIHARRTVHSRRTCELQWTIADSAPGLPPNRSKVEIWYNREHALELTLVSPSQKKLGPFRFDSTYTIRRKGEPAGYVFNRKAGGPRGVIDRANRDNNLVVLFSPLMETGDWQLRLRPLDDGTGLPFEIHAWTETDEQPSTIGDDRATDHGLTLNTFGCGHSPIVVGAYETLPPNSKLRSSGEGPTRDGKMKPEVSAPGVVMTAALALTDSTAAFRGTSIAAPHVAGVVALLMQAAGKPLPVETIRDLTINSTRDDPPVPDSGWDSCYGAGRVDAVAALRALMPAQQTSVSVTVTHTEVVVDEVVATSPDGDKVAGIALAGLSKTAATITVSEVSGGDDAGDAAEDEAAEDNAGGGDSPPPPTFKPPVTMGH